MSSHELVDVIPLRVPVDVDAENGTEEFALHYVVPGITGFVDGRVDVVSF